MKNTQWLKPTILGMTLLSMTFGAYQFSSTDISYQNEIKVGRSPASEDNFLKSQKVLLKQLQENDQALQQSIDDVNTKLSSVDQMSKDEVQSLIQSLGKLKANRAAVYETFQTTIDEGSLTIANLDANSSSLSKLNQKMQLALYKSGKEIGTLKETIQTFKKNLEAKDVEISRINAEILQKITFLENHHSENMQRSEAEKAELKNQSEQLVQVYCALQLQKENEVKTLETKISSLQEVIAKLSESEEVYKAEVQRIRNLPEGMQFLIRLISSLQDKVNGKDDIQVPYALTKKPVTKPETETDIEEEEEEELPTLSIAGTGAQTVVNDDKNNILTESEAQKAKRIAAEAKAKRLAAEEEEEAKRLAAEAKAKEEAEQRTADLEAREEAVKKAEEEAKRLAEKRKEELEELEQEIADAKEERKKKREEKEEEEEEERIAREQENMMDMMSNMFNQFGRQMYMMRRQAQRPQNRTSYTGMDFFGDYPTRQNYRRREATPYSISRSLFSPPEGYYYSQNDQRQFNGMYDFTNNRSSNDRYFNFVGDTPSTSSISRGRQLRGPAFFKF